MAPDDQLSLGDPAAAGDGAAAIPAIVEADCAIVGGGPAGLSAAVHLGRLRRRPLVIDDRSGRSLWSQVTRNYLGFPDGIRAADLRLSGRRQAARYGARFVEGRVASVGRHGEGFRLLVEPRTPNGAGTAENVARDEDLGLALGEVAPSRPVEVVAPTVLLATGVRDHFPDFPGRDACVGRSLFWCITCDGYETIDRAVIVVGHDEEAVETALDMLEFTRRVSIVAGRAEGFGVAERRLGDLAAAGIPAYPTSVAAYPNHDGQIEALVLGDPGATCLPVDMVFVVRPSTARNELALQLGVALDEHGQIVVDNEQLTNVGGVYAAGDATSLHDHLVTAAVHEGAEAACAVNYYLYAPVQKDPSATDRAPGERPVERQREMG